MSSALGRTRLAAAFGCGTALLEAVMCPPPLSRGRGWATRRPILLFPAQQFLPTQIKRVPRAAMLVSVRRRAACLNRYLVVQQVPDRTIEIGCIRALKHHFQIVALLPMRLAAELRLDQIVEFGPG